MKIIEKNIDISVPQNLNLLIDELKSLPEKGISEVSVLIKNTSNLDISSEGIDEFSFNKIKDLQELPEWVVYDLFKSQGSIVSKESFGKISNFEK